MKLLDYVCVKKTQDDTEHSEQIKEHNKNLFLDFGTIMGQNSQIGRYNSAKLGQ